MVRQVQNSTDISTAQFFEHYSRLTKAYEKEGVSLQDRMIPYYMSDSFQRFKDLILNNEADFREYVVKPFIQPYVDQYIRENAETIQVENSEKLRVPYNTLDSEEKKKWREEIFQSIIEAYWRKPQEFLFQKLLHKYMIAGFHERRLYAGGGSADAIMTLGSKREEKKQYYATWYGRGEIIKLSTEDAPSIYMTGDPGTGKTNGSHVLVEEMIACNYWIYTNMPIVSEYGNVFLTKHYSDLYIDAPEMPSIIRAQMWAKRHKISSGSYLVYDEGGRGAASKSVTLQAEALRAHLQIRRHFRSGMFQLGAQRMQARMETSELLDYLIEAKKTPTGKMNDKREPIYKYYWDIATRGPKTTLHEQVYDIPLTRLKLNYANEMRLPYPFDMDMIDLPRFETEVDFVTTPVDQLIAKARDYVRENYRPDLIGAPVFEWDDEKTVEKMKEKEEIREAILSTVKQDDLEIDKDQIEAIGEMRKRGIKMFDIASELGIQLPVITKICRQYGWL